MTNKMSTMPAADDDDHINEGLADHPDDTAERFVDAQIEARLKADPMSAGITALRDAGLDPLRLWTVKAPKDAGGTISAVFLQATSEVLIMHQLASGRFVLFAKTSVEAFGPTAAGQKGGAE